ncbi:MAG TPA: fructosamine kinase family protein [Steroidobacteraceae bacterium]|nr:fructosamine kinase family protein [Steroidobacteraceae bacterium]
MPDPIAAALTQAIGVNVIEGSAEPVGGGSIHQSLRYRTKHGSIFVKVGSIATAAMFEAEAVGLKALSDAEAIRVPTVLALGEYSDRSFLCLEWLDLTSTSEVAEEKFGSQLAALHRSQAQAYGAHPDNFIGRTPQSNRSTSNWPDFFREQRLLPQLERARHNGADSTTLHRGAQLAESLDAFFIDYQPAASLLHGDLWGGNWGATREGAPAIFDPAVYYGDREADIAMTRLFGGFGRAFYAAYEAAWPLDVGATEREVLYNLYHVLNHFNLFGGGYLAQARQMIERALAEVKM